MMSCNAVPPCACAEKVDLEDTLREDRSAGQGASPQSVEAQLCAGGK